MGGVRLSSSDFKKPVRKALKDNDGSVFVRVLLHYERSWVMEEGGTTNKDSFSPLSHTNTAIQPSNHPSTHLPAISPSRLFRSRSWQQETKNLRTPLDLYYPGSLWRKLTFAPDILFHSARHFPLSVRWHTDVQSSGTDDMRAGEKIKNRLMVVENSPEAVQFWLSSKKKNRNFPYNPEKNAFIKRSHIVQNWLYQCFLTLIR